MARKYASEKRIPLEHLPNVEKTMRSIRLAGIERARHCRHLYIRDENGGEAYDREVRWEAFCSLIGHHTYVPRTDSKEVIDKLKRTYCEFCDKRDPLK